MMLKTKQTVTRSLMLKLAAVAQVALLVFAGSANAQEGNRLQDIQVQSLPGERVELKLIMSGTAPEPLAFTIDDPARIALDLPGDGRSALAQAELPRELGRRSAPAVTVVPGCPARIALPPEDPFAVPDVTVLDRRSATSCA